MEKMSTRTGETRTAHISAAPKPISYSYFCCFNQPKNILVCPDKKMPKLSDVEEIGDESPFSIWIKNRKNEVGKE